MGPGGWRWGTRGGPGRITPFREAAADGYTAMDSGGLLVCAGQWAGVRRFLCNPPGHDVVEDAGGVEAWARGMAGGDVQGSMLSSNIRDNRATSPIRPYPYVPLDNPVGRP